MIGIIGFGFWGRRMAQYFQKAEMLSLICDRLAEALNLASREFPGITTVLSLHEMLQVPDMKAVAIATPKETRVALAREALTAGKHVFMAPPFTLRNEETKELFGLAHNQSLIFAPVFLSLHIPAVSELLRRVHSGSLGRITAIASNLLNPPETTQSKKDAMAFCPDNLAVLLQLSCETPHTIWSTGHTSQGEDSGVTAMQLSFPSGLTAISILSRRHPFPARQISVAGQRATAVLDAGCTGRYDLTIFPSGASEAQEQAAISQTDPLALACAEFTDRLRSGTNRGIDANFCLRLAKVLSAAQASLDTRQPERIPTAADTEAFVHPTAVVDENVTLSKGVRIWHFCHILANCSIGENTNIGQNVMAGPGVTVGKNCKIQNNVSVYPGVTLEDGVFCGPSMVFTNVHNPRATIPRMDQARPTPVRIGATLGANCTIVCGNEIGAYAFVGAGAVVTKPVPAHAMVVGNPARRVGWVCRCGVRLDPTLSCEACKARYELAKGGLRLISDPQAPQQPHTTSGSKE